VPAEAADLAPARISAFAGSAVAAGRVVGMLFERWPARCWLPGAPAAQARRVILHVAIGHRWPFAFPDESRSKA
jgi:hypothetical protein